MDWQVISSIGAIISSLAAISAILIGFYQYRNTIERTDTQIQFIKEAANQKSEENRPLLTIAKSYAAGIKTYWQFKLGIENIGIRPAYNVSVESVVVSIDDNFNNYEVSDKAIFTMVNPIAKSSVIDYIGNIYYKKFESYYIKILLHYTDDINGTVQHESFYFRWRNFKGDKDFNPHLLYNISMEDKNKFDKILNEIK